MLVLSSKEASADNWKGTTIAGVHNGFIQSEIERVRAEHPGEDEAMMGFRVLGAIMVTRGESASIIQGVLANFIHLQPLVTKNLNLMLNG